MKKIGHRREGTLKICRELNEKLNKLIGLTCILTSNNTQKKSKINVTFPQEVGLKQGKVS